MAQGIFNIEGKVEMRPPVIAVDDEVFAEYSPVTIDSNGFLAVMSSSDEKCWGFCLEAFTAIATNDSASSVTSVQTTNKAVHSYAPPVQSPLNVLFWCDCDIAFTQTDVGAYADIVSESSGVVTMDLAATTAGGFLVMGLLSNWDPSATGDTDKTVFKVSEPFDVAQTQS